MADVLNTALRQSFGTQESRRIRQRGEIPAELYGHGEPNAHLLLPKLEVHAAVRHGAHLVELKGAVNESALIKDVQWDPFGTEVLHLDLTRVSAEETVEVVLHLELKGTAPGLKEGGVLQVVLHDIKILCPAGLIPDKLEIKVGNLHVGGHITAGELELPAGASLVTAADQVLVQCIEPEAQEDLAAVPAEVNEPELIRKPKEEEGSEE
jgi:large subunit ribosomal protein L25